MSKSFLLYPQTRPEGDLRDIAAMLRSAKTRDERDFVVRLAREVGIYVHWVTRDVPATRLAVVARWV
jgi:hypothetical protein